MQTCKHKIKSLGYKQEKWVDNHPYGENEYTNLYVMCMDCEKKIEVNSFHNISSATYEELTGRDLTLEECKALFKCKPEMYHSIRDMNSELKKIVQHNPNLKKKIAMKQKQFDKLKEEIRVLQMQYNGGTDLSWF